MSTPTTAHNGATVIVSDGNVTIQQGQTDEAAAISWDHEIGIIVNGAPAPGTDCKVRPGDEIIGDFRDVKPEVQYECEISRDRMEGRLTVQLVPGKRFRFADAGPAAELELTTTYDRLPAQDPDIADALHAIKEAGIVVGVDEDAVARACSSPGETVAIAVGQPKEDGMDGQLEDLVDWDEAWKDGVTAGTALMQRIPKVEGKPGLDVTSRELQPKPVQDPKMRAGEGAVWDDEQLLLIAEVDGSARVHDLEKRVDVKHELELDNVDGTTGDIDFIGSVKVWGSVAPGRSLRAKHEILVTGNAERADIESGSHLEIQGTVMSSELRAGGDKAVFVGLIDTVREVPGWLIELGIQAGELREAAIQRGQDMPFGLSIQVVLEHRFSKLLQAIDHASNELREAGERHEPMANRFHGWAVALRTSANEQSESADFQNLVREAGETIATIQHAVEDQANLRISYMQASEIEATGVVTITGKGIFNSRVVAWDGLESVDGRAVVRGGEVTCHGNINVREVGSPGGATMRIMLGSTSHLEAETAYAGTILLARYGTHRFIADRTDVVVQVDDSGLDVTSFAA